jgi:hypothetical protein
MKIYKLVKDGEVVYIGRTKLSLSRRKAGKFYEMNRDFITKCSIELIEETDDKGRERYWIDHYTEIGCNLLNKKGGDFSSAQDSYKHRLNKIKERSTFVPMTKEQKLEKQREYRRRNREEINRKKREKYANGDSWYHRKNKLPNF